MVLPVPCTHAARSCTCSSCQHAAPAAPHASRVFSRSLTRTGGGAKAVQDAQAKGKGKGKKKEEEDEPETYYDAMKRELVERAAKTRTALDAFDPATRVAMEVGVQGWGGDGMHSCSSGGAGGGTAAEQVAASRLLSCTSSTSPHPSPPSLPFLPRATAPARTCGCASAACPASWSPTLTRASPYW